MNEDRLLIEYALAPDVWDSIYVLDEEKGREMFRLYDEAGYPVRLVRIHRTILLDSSDKV